MHMIIINMGGLARAHFGQGGSIDAGAVPVNGTLKRRERRAPCAGHGSGFATIGVGV